MMILFRITNAYIHDCRNEVRRSQLQIRQDDRALAKSESYCFPVEDYYCTSLPQHEIVGNGFRPQSVVAGFLAAPNLQYLAEKEYLYLKVYCARYVLCLPGDRESLLEAQESLLEAQESLLDDRKMTLEVFCSVIRGTKRSDGNAQCLTARNKIKQ